MMDCRRRRTGQGSEGMEHKEERVRVYLFGSSVDLLASSGLREERIGEGKVGRQEGQLGWETFDSDSDRTNEAASADVPVGSE